MKLLTEYVHCPSPARPPRCVVGAAQRQPNSATTCTDTIVFPVLVTGLFFSLRGGHLPSVSTFAQNTLFPSRRACSQDVLCSVLFPRKVCSFAHYSFFSSRCALLFCFFAQYTFPCSGRVPLCQTRLSSQDVFLCMLRSCSFA